MHPIEQLRFVARSSGVDAHLLVEEAASALSFFTFEPRALITASRRLLTRQPAAGPLWTLCSRMLLGADAQHEAWDVLDGVRNDLALSTLGSLLGIDDRVHCSDRSSLLARRVGEEFEVTRSVSDADVVVISGSAWGRSGVSGNEVLVGPIDERALVNASEREIPVWIVLGAGTQLPSLYWDEAVARCNDLVADVSLSSSSSQSTGHRRIALSRFDRLVTSAGLVNENELKPPTLAVAPELLVQLG